ncbi:MAG: hypothetical protein Q8P50_13160 [Bacillota bacterium]|nr:hypothetical protein [Bacillota bacterium]
MSVIEVLEVADASTKRQYIRFPWAIYKDYPRWVPPLLQDAAAVMSPASNPLLQTGPWRFLVALAAGRPVGRLLAGLDTKFNQAKGANDGYVSQFESVDVVAVAGALFDHASRFLAGAGAVRVKGPVSPTNGDEQRGVLVEGFEHMPALFQAYNPPYYPRLFEACGFQKLYDYFAFRTPLDSIPPPPEALEYAVARYGFRADPVDFKRLESEAQDIKQVLDASMPGEWPDLIPPTIEEILAMGRRLRGVGVPELTRIARAGGKPVGLSVALPDYNQVLKRMNGRLFPTGWITYLLGRRSIDTVVMFITFVVPEFHNKGVTQYLYYSTLREALRLGYTWGEGSTVLETNTTMIRQVRRLKGIHHKTYRVYCKHI